MQEIQSQGGAGVKRRKRSSKEEQVSKGGTGEIRRSRCQKEEQE